MSWSQSTRVICDRTLVDHKLGGIDQSFLVLEAGTTKCSSLFSKLTFHGMYFAVEPERKLAKISSSNSTIIQATMTKHFSASLR